MSIVGGLLRSAGLGTLSDALESQGLLKAGGLFDSRVVPTTTPEMFIGGAGIANLEKAGVMEAAPAIQALEDAQKDWFKLPAEDWMKKWADTGIAFDPVANKAMMELSDQNVSLKKGVDLNKMGNEEILGFDEVFNAETLKKAYPDISNIKIGFVDDPNSPRLAGFDSETDTIYFNRQNPNWSNKEAKSNVLHEIQHYVQGKELFTQGEGFTQVLQNNAQFQTNTSAVDKLVATSVPDVVKFAKQNQKLGFTSDNVSDALGALVARDGLSADKALAKAFKSKDMATKFMNAVRGNPKLEGILVAKNEASTAYQQSIKEYMKVAGEVFARQTGERADMSAAERLANPAMRGIETNPTNAAWGVTLDNMTAPLDRNNTIADAYFVPEWKLKEQSRAEQEQGFSRKLNNPIKLKDGSRLSGFTSNSQEVFYGYDKNGEVFTIRKEYVKPDDIVGSRDSNKTAEMIRSRLPASTSTQEFANPMQTPQEFSDPFASQIPQSTIQGI